MEAPPAPAAPPVSDDPEVLGLLEDGGVLGDAEGVLGEGIAVEPAPDAPEVPEVAPPAEEPVAPEVPEAPEPIEDVVPPVPLAPLLGDSPALLQPATVRVITLAARAILVR